MKLEIATYYVISLLISAIFIWDASRLPENSCGQRCQPNDQCICPSK
jgi:hypothetical protein